MLCASTSAKPIGYNDTFATPIGYNDTFASLSEAGFGGGAVVRFPVGDGYLSGTQAAVDEALAAGVEPIIVPSGWSMGTDEDTVEEYAQIMAAAARHYPEATLGLWNEPNLVGGTEEIAMPPRQAAEFSVAAATAIRAVNPSARIVGPPIAPVESLGWRQYFRRTYRRIPANLEVEVAVNIYLPGRDRKQRLVEIFEMAAQFGPVAVTEFDPSPPWLSGKSAGWEQVARLVRVMVRRKATMILFHDVERFAPALARLKAEG